MSPNKSKGKFQVQKSLLDVDQMVQDGVESFCLGRYQEAEERFRQALTGIDERFGSVPSMPIDVLVRRFSILQRTAETHEAQGSLDASLKTRQAMREMAVSHLADDAAFQVISSLELVRNLLQMRNVTVARDALSEGTQRLRSIGGDEPYLQSLVLFATSEYMLHFGKTHEALRTIHAAAARAPEPDSIDSCVTLSRIHLKHCELERLVGRPPLAAEIAFKTFQRLLDFGDNAFRQFHLIDALRCYCFAASMAELLDRTPPHMELLAAIQIGFGDALELRGRWIDSLRAYQEGLRIIQLFSLQNPALGARAHSGAGNVLMQLKDYDGARTQLEVASKVAFRTENPLDAARVNYLSGIVNFKGAKEEKGLEYFDSAKSTLSDNDTPDAHLLIARIDNQLSFVETRRGNFDSAAERLHRNLDTLGKHPNAYVLGETHRLLGELATAQLQYKRAEDHFRKALDFFEKAGAIYESARAHRSFGVNHARDGDLKDAAYYLEEGIRLHERLNIEAELPMLYSEMAEIHILEDNYVEAERLYNKENEIAKKQKNPNSLAYALLHRGRVRRLLGRVHLGIDDVKRALELFESVKNLDMTAQALLELALCESERHNLKAATDLCGRARILCDTTRNNATLARAHLVRGILLRYAKDFKRRAVIDRAFEDAILFYEKNRGDSAELADACYEYALFLRDVRDNPRAATYLIKAINACKKSGLEKKGRRHLDLLRVVAPADAARIAVEIFAGDGAAETLLSDVKSDGTVRVARRVVTILFVDIRNFSHLSERLSLDDLTGVLNDFYSNCTDVAVAHRGTVNKFIGDAAMCLFNIDGKLADHQLWAVRAGLDLLATIDDINRRRMRQGMTTFEIGIGINTGEVLLGSFGAAMRQDFTAIGDHVNIASRLEGLNKVFGVRLIASDYTIGNLGGALHARELDNIRVMGKDEPIKVYEVLGLKEDL